MLQPLSCVRHFATLWAVALQASLSFTISQSLLKLKSTESMMPSNHVVLCHPLPLLASIFPSIRVFSNESALHIRWPKYWNFIFSISPSNEYSGLISFRIDWFDLFAVQGTLKSLIQHHNSKALVLWLSVVFVVELSHLCMTTGKTSGIRASKHRVLRDMSIQPTADEILHFSKFPGGADGPRTTLGEARAQRASEQVPCFSRASTLSFHP